jgi:hypothetical protein
LICFLQQIALRIHLSTKEHLIRTNCFIAAVLLIASVVNAQESTKTNPHESWVYLKNADIRVGLLRSHGGAIAHLSTPTSDFNVLNHYDHGRLVQQSYYGDEDGSKWGNKPWRYNPVQGGDYKGKAAEILDFESTEHSAYVKTMPRNWASGKMLDECTMEQWVELDGPILKVKYKFTYNGDISHQARHQETPAVFVSSKLSTLVAYTGDKPWTSLPLTQMTPGWPNEYLKLSEEWAAYLGEDGSGVGVYVPGATEATCYRYKGGAGSDCSYIAPLHTFALTPELSFSYTAFFTLGDAETIRKRFATLHVAE